MRAPTFTHMHLGSASFRHGAVAELLPRLGRFAMHYVEMCLVMCVGGISLSVLFFGGAALLGFDELPDSAPVLTVVVVAINLSLPMLVWMRFMGMAWRPTLEMSGATMAAGLGLIVAYGIGLVDKGDLLGLQTGILACPLMLAVMLSRFGLYSAKHTRHHARAAH